MGSGKSTMQWTNDAGNAYLETCELEIGGQVIDKHDCWFNNIYSNLFDWNSGGLSGLINETDYSSIHLQVRIIMPFPTPVQLKTLMLSYLLIIFI